MKLFTLGDSISQGFMSAGAAKPHLGFGALLAGALGDTSYSYLPWTTEHHLKVDLEYVLRALESKYGPDIRGLEWAGALKTINRILDEAEDYFERGDGKPGKPVDSAEFFHAEFFHNVAVEGMTVGDSWKVTPALCKKMVSESQNRASRKDNFFKPASDAFYRNAYRVLNPRGAEKDNAFGQHSPLAWLDYHCRNGDGVENTTLWFGANNALGTVVNLEIKQTPGDGKVVDMSREDRQKYNLWHPHDFALEYGEMLNRVDNSMRGNQNSNWRVFVGTIPLVTIAPVARGMGETRIIEETVNGRKRKALYYQYYSYFMFTLENALRTQKYLKFSEARFIDKNIIRFNEIIKRQIKSLNETHGTERYFVVDIGSVLRDLAWKRNMGMPTYALPEELAYSYPQVDTKYYHATRDGRIRKGGVFSLDGIHPTAVGQGIIAFEFLKAMQNAGAADPRAALDWQAILKSDTLRQHPIRLMEEWYEHEELINFIGDAIRLICP